MKLEIEQLTARLSRPFATASGTVDERELVLVGLEDQDGAVGWGEAAPLEVPAGEVLAALGAFQAVLASAQGDAHPELLAACARVAPLPEALAAVDLALWDLAARRAGQPVWRMLGQEDALAVPVNATVAAADRAGAAEQAGGASRAGFRCLKVKVGLPDDAERLAAVRAAAGPEVAIRLDANGAWSVPEARRALHGLAPVGIELCEEPVHGLAAVAELVSGCEIPIAIDETARDPEALSRRVCAAICLKISRCGGLTATVDAARRARACGYEVYLASMLDGPLGIAAALHAAAVIRPDRACGLATLAWFADRPDPLAPQAGAITVPGSPGLGDGLVAWY